jgi:hypothetical protein
MSIGRIARYCAALAFSLTLSGMASAAGATVNSDPCPPSHGASGSGYRDMLVRLRTEPAPAARTAGVANAGGYRDSAARFSNAQRTGPLDSPRKIVGGGYRDSVARFPGTVSSESPQHAMLRCGRLDSI